MGILDVDFDIARCSKSIRYLLFFSVHTSIKHLKELYKFPFYTMFYEITALTLCNNSPNF